MVNFYFRIQLIEKKRRDRINSCLTELRRLVPAAVDKQVILSCSKLPILVVQTIYIMIFFIGFDKIRESRDTSTDSGALEERSKPCQTRDR